MEKAYETYKDTSSSFIKDIPSHWKKLKVKHLVDRNTYYPVGDGDHGSIKPSMYQQEGIPYIRVQNLSWGGTIDISNAVYISEDVQKANKKSNLFPGDILIAKTGATIGKLGLITDEIKEANTTSSVGKLTVDLKYYNPKYILYCFQSKNFNDQIWLEASQKSAQPGFNIDDLIEFEIASPKIQEQTQIAAYLDYHTQLIDTLIEKIEKSKEVLKEYRLSLVEKVLINKKVNRIQLRHVVNSINRPIEYNDEKYFTKIGMYNWNRGLFLYPKTLGQDLGDSKFQIIKEGDLIISGQFAWEGAVSLVTDNENDCIASHRFHVLNGKNDIILNEYLMAYFTSQEGHFILNDNSNGSAGRNRPLNINNLLKEKIPVPNLDIQLEIKKVVKKEQKNIVYSSKIIQKLKDYRQSLISEAVTGKIDVRDWQHPENKS
ncbi:hypothetical protein KUL113_63800 [Tenacibaculum sp. KUL113]|nr:hypothetical protein KUL113_63800 [Tenacibaculum sp. KUL113]